jgi:hypothetical protein
MKTKIRLVYVIRRDELEIVGAGGWGRRDGKREKWRRPRRENRARRGCSAIHEKLYLQDLIKCSV